MASISEQIYAEILTAISLKVSSWADYTLAVQTPNGQPIDQATQTNPYLDIIIQELTADQLDLSDKPIVGQRGQIILSVVCKEGKGWREAVKLREHFLPALDMKVLGLVHCFATSAQPQKSHKGWVWWPMLTNYYAHRVSG